jgi:high-affinity nickel permease
MAEQAVDLANLRTWEEIRKAFETLKCNEDQTDKELETLLSSHRFIDAELKEYYNLVNFRWEKCRMRPLKCQKVLVLQLHWQMVCQPKLNNWT